MYEARVAARGPARTTSTSSASDELPDPASRHQPAGPARAVADRRRRARSRGPTTASRRARCRAGHLRAARRHVHARRARSTPRSSTSPSSRGSASPRSRSCPSPSSPATTAGATTASTSAPRSRPTAGPLGFQRLVDAAHAHGARRDPRRRLQPRRRVGQPGAGGLRPVLHRQVLDVLGHGDQLRRRALRPRARVGPAVRRGLGRATSTSTGCASTRSTRSTTRARSRCSARARRPRARGAARAALVIAESGLNDPKVIRPRELGGFGHDAQWADDFHHALRVLLTGDSDGWYAEFGTVADLAKAYRAPFCPRRPVLGVSPEALRRARARPPAGAVRRLRRRTTTRSATARSATACPTTRARSRRSARCCRRSCRCSSWARSTASRRRFSSSPTTSTRRSRPRRVTGAGASSPPSRSSPGEEVPDPQDRATFERSKLTRERDPADRRPLRCSCCASRAELPRTEVVTAARRRRALAGRRPRPVSAVRELRRRAARGPARRPCARSCSRPPRPSCSPGHVLLGTQVRSPAAMSDREVWPGRPFPLGPTWDGRGHELQPLQRERRARRAVPVRRATTTRSASRSSSAPRSTGTATCRASAPASATATASIGPYDPECGHRFNAHKLLIDPYAKAIDGEVRWELGSTLPYIPDDSDTADLEPDDDDDADAMPKGLVVDPGFDWEGDDLPRTPWNETVIYETHVKGFTKLPPRRARGPARHLRRPGVAAGAEVPQGPRRHGGRAAARPPHRRRALPRPRRACRTTGATARSATSRRTPTTRRPARPASRCASSRAWSRRCTRPASR